MSPTIAAAGQFPWMGPRQSPFAPPATVQVASPVGIRRPRSPRDWSPCVVPLAGWPSRQGPHQAPQRTSRAQPASASEPPSPRAALDEVAQAEAMAMEAVHIPASFRCPITHEVMVDPVETEDGQVYERAAILNWFQRGNCTSPMTGYPLPSLVLRASAPLRRAIEEFVAARPGIVRKELNRISIEMAAATLEADLLAKSSAKSEDEADLKRERARAERAEAKLQELEEAISHERARAGWAEEKSREACETAACMQEWAELAEKARKDAQESADNATAALEVELARSRAVDVSSRERARAERAETRLREAEEIAARERIKSERAEAALKEAKETAARLHAWAEHTEAARRVAQNSAAHVQALLATPSTWFQQELDSPSWTGEEAFRRAQESHREHELHRDSSPIQVGIGGIQSPTTSRTASRSPLPAPLRPSLHSIENCWRNEPHSFQVNRGAYSARSKSRTTTPRGDLRTQSTGSLHAQYGRAL